MFWVTADRCSSTCRTIGTVVVLINYIKRVFGQIDSTIGSQKLHPSIAATASRLHTKMIVGSIILPKWTQSLILPKMRNGLPLKSWHLVVSDSSTTCVFKKGVNWFSRGEFEPAPVSRKTNNLRITKETVRYLWKPCKFVFSTKLFCLTFLVLKTLWMDKIIQRGVSHGCYLICRFWRVYRMALKYAWAAIFNFFTGWLRPFAEQWDLLDFQRLDLQLQQFASSVKKVFLVLSTLNFWS